MWDHKTPVTCMRWVVPIWTKLTEKDLEIHIDSELKFRKRAAAAAAKGNQLLALLIK